MATGVAPRVDPPQENEVNLTKKYEKEQEDIKHLKEFISSCGTYSNLVKQAQSKQKIIDKMELVEAPVFERRPKLVLPEPPDSSHEMIELSGVTLGWPGGPDVLGISGAAPSPAMERIIEVRPVACARSLVSGFPCRGGVSIGAADVAARRCGAGDAGIDEPAVLRGAACSLRKKRPSRAKRCGQTRSYSRESASRVASSARRSVKT